MENLNLEQEKILMARRQKNVEKKAMKYIGVYNLHIHTYKLPNVPIYIYIHTLSGGPSA